jgi:hypothetical protein
MAVVDGEKLAEGLREVIAEEQAQRLIDRESGVTQSQMARDEDSPRKR